MIITEIQYFFSKIIRFQAIFKDTVEFTCALEFKISSQRGLLKRYNKVIPIIIGEVVCILVFFEQKNYNVVCGGMRYGLHDIERGKRKMGRDPTMDKLLLHCGSHPRCCKNGDDLADSENCGKAD